MVLARGRPVSTANRYFIESNNDTTLYKTALHQCHVCLGSHLTKFCLPCVLTSKTTAIYVRWRHNMCYFLGCKDTPGSISRSLGLGRPSFQTKTFLMLTGVYKKAIHPFTMHHPMHLLTKTNAPSIYMPCSCQQLSLVPRLYIFLE